MGINLEQDIYWMQQALKEAEKAIIKQEVPVGAVLIKDNQLVARAHNSPISCHDPSAHAEVLTIRQAASSLKNYRLPNTTLYVTLEPCMMCIGLLIHARIQRLVFGAYDSKLNCTSSLTGLYSRANHSIEIQGGVLEAECSKLLIKFFEEKRNATKK